MFRLLLTLSLILLSSPAIAAKRDVDGGAEQVYSRTENSVFTIEVHTGNRETKSVLGSGYLIGPGGKIVTNYHVIDAYVEEPQSYFIRVRNRLGQFAAELVAFDVINDLALLEAKEVDGKPFKINSAGGIPQGTSIVSLGNPMGFNLSIIRGIFNGFAQKGLIDRMLLSMPLNSGMSGGPILNAKDELIGTNVSIIWLSNSLSFGVPANKLDNLLTTRPLKKDKELYRQEVYRQLLEIERTTAENLSLSLKAREKSDTVMVGNAQFDRPPDIFDCWDDARNTEDEGIIKSTYSCNLQFTPTLGGYREVASVELLVEHLSTQQNSYGFYGFLSNHGGAHQDTAAKNNNEVRNSSPHCSVERVRSGGLVWKLNTCANAYVDYPELYDFSMVGTSVTQSKQAVYFGLHMKGFRLASFTDLSQAFLERLRLASKP